MGQLDARGAPHGHGWQFVAFQHYLQPGALPLSPLTGAEDLQPGQVTTLVRHRTYVHHFVHQLTGGISGRVLRDAVEAVVVLLSMTEDYAKRYNGRVYVRAPAHRAASLRGERPSWLPEHLIPLIHLSLCLCWPLTGGSDEEEDEEGEQKASRADDTGADDVLNLGRIIGNVANNNIITNCCLLLKYHRLNSYVFRPCLESILTDSSIGLGWT